MCIIIDTNTLASVFDENSMFHSEFKPVYDWVKTGNGKVVYGGTKYLEELKTKYLAVFLELRRNNRAIYVNDDQVDAEEAIVSAMIQHANFDDQHLVGLLRISGCKLICSLDGRAFPYFKHPDFFHPASNRPKIYSRLRHQDLLTNRNIAPICKN